MAEGGGVVAACSAPFWAAAAGIWPYAAARPNDPFAGAPMSTFVVIGMAFLVAGALIADLP